MIRTRFAPAKGIAALSIAVPCWLVLGPASAETAARDPVAAQALFDSAKELLKTGDWAGACDKLRKSMDLDPSVSTLVKIGKCHEHEGRFATAWYEYRRALDMNRDANFSETRRAELDAFIRGAVADIEPRVPKLRIEVAPVPAGLQVFRDGELLEATALDEPIAVDPGEHTVQARAPGWVGASLQVNVVQGSLALASLSLTPAPRAGSAGSRPDAPGPVARATSPESRVVSPVHSEVVSAPASDATPAPIGTERTSTLRTVGVAVGGMGVAVLAAAGFFGLRTLDLVQQSNDRCQSDGCDPTGMMLRGEARDAQTIGLVLAGCGVASVGVGITLFAIASRSGHGRAAARASPRLEAMVTPSSVLTRGSW